MNYKKKYNWDNGNYSSNNNFKSNNQINKVKTKKALVLSKPRIFGLQFKWYTEFAESLLI